MSEIPAYVGIERLCQELGGVCHRTIRRWQADGFPKEKRHGLFEWAEVKRYMDHRSKSAIASETRTQEEEIRNAAKEIDLGKRGHVLPRAPRLRRVPSVHHQR